MLRKVVLRGSPGAVAAMAMVNTDFTDIIDNIKVPSLIIWGEEDNIAQLRTGKLLASKLTDGRLIIVKHAGHVPITEQVDRFHEILFQELAQPVASLKKEESTRINETLSCTNQADKVYTGNYNAVHIKNSHRILLQNVKMNYINIENSNVVIENSIIDGKKIGIEISTSHLTGTALTIKGETAIKASASRIDFAGVDIVGRKFGIKTDKTSAVLFSVSKIKSPLTHKNMHGFFKVTKDTPL